MERLIPFEKRSKKKQREQNAKRRGSWCGLNPVTRRPEPLRAYNRQKARRWGENSMTVPFAMPGRNPANAPAILRQGTPCRSAFPPAPDNRMMVFYDAT